MLTVEHRAPLQGFLKEAGRTSCLLVAMAVSLLPLETQY